MVMKFVKLYWVVYKYIVQMGILLSLSLFPSPLFFLFSVQYAPCKHWCPFSFNRFYYYGARGRKPFQLKNEKN